VAAGVASVFGAVGAGDDFEFLNAVHRRLQRERVLVVIVVIHAVDEIAVELFAPPAGMHGESASLGQFGILHGGRHAGRQKRQLQEIAAIERKILDLRLMEYHTQLGRIGGNELHGGDDVDGVSQ